MAGIATPLFGVAGSHSQTWPSSNSSQDSQVPHGVGPPAQLWGAPQDPVGVDDLAVGVVLDRAGTALPENGTSLFTTWIPAAVVMGKVAAPSGNPGHSNACPRRTPRPGPPVSETVGQKIPLASGCAASCP